MIRDVLGEIDLQPLMLAGLGGCGWSRNWDVATFQNNQFILASEATRVPCLLLYLDYSKYLSRDCIFNNTFVRLLGGISSSPLVICSNADARL